MTPMKLRIPGRDGGDGRGPGVLVGAGQGRHEAVRNRPTPGPRRAHAPRPRRKPASRQARAGRRARAAPARGGRPARQGRDALERGNKNLAEQLFSTAELLVGPEALASLAPHVPRGRAAARDHADAEGRHQRRAAAEGGGQLRGRGRGGRRSRRRKVEVGSLTGTLQIDGKAPPARSASSRSSPRAASGSRARRSAS